MKKSKIILDASVIIKYITRQEVDHDLATKIIGEILANKYYFILPALWQYEVFNYLSRELPPKKVNEIMNEVLGAFDNYRNPTSAEWTMAAQLVKKYKAEKISAYDAIYHAMALVNNGIFVTADEKYFMKVKKEGNICSLKSFN